ncbi:MAG: hypothetical protein IID46_09515 [Planctomycetes bacterium]|nr:hypothetical protein [Planctomycetota bacterium]
MSATASYATNPSSTTPSQYSAPERATIPVRFDTIPHELILLPQWVVWKWEWSVAKQKWKKPPFDPRTGWLANHPDPTTWGTFADALGAYQSGGYDGIGFVFSTVDPYFGTDLDNCRDPATGTIKSWALDIIQSLDSYTEVSPSGTGVKILARGKLPPGRRVKKISGGKTEVYDTARYFTVTGQVVAGLPTILSDRQAEIDSLHRRLFSQTKQNVPQGSTPAVALTSESSLILDDQIISLLTAKPKYRRLWQGRYSLWTGKKRKYASQSEADAALVSRLARLTPDAVQIDRLFRRSGLVRAKWNEVHYSNGDTYGQALIATALRSTQPLFVEVSFPPEGYQIHRDDYYEKIRVSRSTLPHRKGVFLDRSPCGVGKTTALLDVLRRVPNTLISCPTHENCRDFVNLAQRHGIQAVAHPKLEQTNCEYYQQASKAQASGLDILQTACRSCPAKHRCGRSGYRSMVRNFRKANHQVVTHDRVSKSGLEFLASNKSLIVVQEDAIGFLRSSAAVPYARWDEVQRPSSRIVSAISTEPIRPPNHWIRNSPAPRPRSHRQQSDLD